MDLVVATLLLVALLASAVALVAFEGKPDDDRVPGGRRGAR